eukprot:scaffold9511_cov182-Skeletonema_dohrnii-CCMP3373.AAC.14
MDSSKNNDNQRPTEEQRPRSLSVENSDYTIAGIKGKYTGEINQEGKPHGSGSFVREHGGITYVGEWRDGGRGAHGIMKGGVYMERTRLFVGRSRQSPLAAIMGIWKERRLLLVWRIHYWLFWSRW